MSEQQSSPSQSEEQGGLSNLQVRFLSAAALLPVVFLGVYIGGWLWTALILVLAVVGVLEFNALAKDHKHQGIALVAVPATVVVVLGFKLDNIIISLLALLAADLLGLIVVFFRRRDLRRAMLPAWLTLAGVVYVGLPAGFLVAIRQLDKGILWLLVIFSLTWGTDTFAYFGGRQWGKHKLAPRLSPKKTVEGAVIGIFGGIIPATLILIAGDQWSIAAQLMICIAPFVAIAGDLFESGLKRYYGVKDSGIPGLNIIPGHGGVLDRVDALLAVTALCYLVIRLANLT